MALCNDFILIVLIDRWPALAASYCSRRTAGSSTRRRSGSEIDRRHRRAVSLFSLIVHQQTLIDNTVQRHRCLTVHSSTPDLHITNVIKLCKDYQSVSHLSLRANTHRWQKLTPRYAARKIPLYRDDQSNSIWFLLSKCDQNIHSSTATSSLSVACAL